MFFVFCFLFFAVSAWAENGGGVERKNRGPYNSILAFFWFDADRSFVLGAGGARTPR